MSISELMPRGGGGVVELVLIVLIIWFSGYFGVLNLMVDEVFGSHLPGGVHGGEGEGR